MSSPASPVPGDVEGRIYMAEALQLARKGLMTTDPNPRVGCVIVKDNRVLGRGWHRRAGEPHAERMALADCVQRHGASAARGATVFVTLEPCSHTGRTPPCADALSEAGVQRVVLAMQDPNPQVAGSGIARLREAGIRVDVGLMQTEAEALNPGFIKRMKQGLPWLRIKLAMSLDGRTAMASGESVWISSDASRMDVQRLRARSSAVMTGIGTLLNDDPSLNVRLAAAELGTDRVRQPLRVVLDSQARTPQTARMLDLPGETLLIHVERAEGVADPAAQPGSGAADRQLRRVYLPGDAHGGLHLPTVLRYLAEQENLNEVMLEAGSRLAGSLLQAGLCDEIVVYLAPHLMGDQARGLFHLPGLDSMSQRLALAIKDLRQIGPDVRLVLKPVRSPDTSADENPHETLGDQHPQ